MMRRWRLENREVEEQVGNGEDLALASEIGSSIEKHFPWLVFLQPTQHNAIFIIGEYGVATI